MEEVRTLLAYLYKETLLPYPDEDGDSLFICTTFKSRESFERVLDRYYAYLLKYARFHSNDNRVLFRTIFLDISSFVQQVAKDYEEYPNEIDIYNLNPEENKDKYRANLMYCKQIDIDLYEEEENTTMDFETETCLFIFLTILVLNGFDLVTLD